MESKTVLIAEDDVFVRLVAVDIFQALGYCIREAATAEDALSILIDEFPNISLVFTDIEMPPGSMNGLDLAHEVSRRWPPLRIIIVSGRIGVAAHELPKNSRFLTKPYTATQLEPIIADLTT